MIRPLYHYSKHYLLKYSSFKGCCFKTKSLASFPDFQQSCCLSPQQTNAHHQIGTSICLMRCDSLLFGRNPCGGSPERAVHKLLQYHTGLLEPICPCKVGIPNGLLLRIAFLCNISSSYWRGLMVHLPRTE